MTCRNPECTHPDCDPRDTARALHHEWRRAIEQIDAMRNELTEVRESQRQFKRALLTALGVNDGGWAVSTWRQREFVDAIERLRDPRRAAPPEGGV